MTQQTLFGKEANLLKKKYPDKVEIIIKPNSGPYDESVPIKGGKLFTDVKFSARNYGAGGGCDTPQEIEDSVRHYKEWIKREGDIPIVKDLRIKERLEMENGK